MIAIVDDERFDAHEAPGGGHPERPERLEAAREGLRRGLDDTSPILVEARPVSEDEVTRVHAERYLASLRDALARGRGRFDADTYFSEGTREATERAAGGAVALTEAVLDGLAPTGFGLLRPPGHHARPATPMGFCLVNNIAVAAAAALARGLARVAIVDWDVHHGNGTQEMFYDDPRVFFVSLHQWPCYPGTGRVTERGHGAGRGTTLNLPLPPGADGAVYGAAFRRVVLPTLRRFSPELVLISAGFDAHARDPLASMQLDAETYAAMTTALMDVARESAEGRLVAFLEGGYDVRALCDSVEGVTRAMRGEVVALPEARIGSEFEEALTLAEAPTREGA